MLARNTVIHAVNEYGKAWTTQDADRIAALFTEDAVYVERAFDRNGTFVGREQIREYWLRQICGKQTSIRLFSLVRVPVCLCALACPEFTLLLQFSF